MFEKKSRRDFMTTSIAAALLSSAFVINRSAIASPASGSRYRLKPVARKDSDIVEFGDGFANLYASQKALATFADRPVFGGLSGIFYALINDNMIPVFGYAGYRLNQARIIEAGPDEPARRLDVRSKEAFLYLDLETGKRMERWNNPWTGETVEVYPWIEEGICGPQTAERTSAAFSADAFTSYRYGGLAERHASNPAKPIAYDLPWRCIGDKFLGATHSTTRVSNPVTPAGWPKASSGEFVTQHEHLKIFADAKAMNDPDAAHTPFTGTLTRKMPWLPFMRMGQSGINGGLLALAHCYKITGTIEDVPAPLRKFLEREYPNQLEPMTSWEHTRTKPGSTLQYFARTVPPETPGYRRQD